MAIRRGRAKSRSLHPIGSCGFHGSRKVPAGLKHYQPLVTTMQANVNNYKQVNSLPDFRLFSFFFIIPGALLMLLAGAGLFGGKLAPKIGFHHGARLTPAR